MSSWVRKLTADGRLPAEARFFEQHRYLPRPRLIQWLATLRCELSCPHCLAAADAAELADMPLAAALDLVDQAAALGVGQFLITGGSRWPASICRRSSPASINGDCRGA